METFANMNDVSLGLMGVTANTVRALSFLRRKPDDIGMVVNPSKTMVLPPKGRAPMPEENSPLESVYVRIADEGRVTVVLISRSAQIGAGESNESSEGWRRGPPGALPRKHAGQASGDPHRHRIPRAENKLSPKDSGHGTVPRSLQEGRQRSAVGVREDPRATGRGGGIVVYSGGFPG